MHYDNEKEHPVSIMAIEQFWSNRSNLNVPLEPCYVIRASVWALSKYVWKVIIVLTSTGEVHIEPTEGHSWFMNNIIAPSATAFGDCPLYRPVLFL